MIPGSGAQAAVAQKGAQLQRVRPRPLDPGFAPGGQLRKIVSGMVSRGVNAFQAPPAPAPAPQPVSEHGAGMGGAGRPTAPSPQQFALQRLKQLQAMGVNPGMAGVANADPAATWREISPIMGAILQARAGQAPQVDLSRFQPAVQALVQKILEQATSAPYERT